MMWTKRFSFIFLFIFTFLFQAPLTLAATTFDLIAPSGQLTRGQEIQFTINIDTKGSAVSSVQIGLTYQTQYIQYLSTTPGETMSQLTARDLGNGSILFTGTNTSGFTGKGVFAYVNFKIIAAASGSTELCTLFVPSPTPTPINPSATSIPGTPLPTRLPKSGSTPMTMSIVGGTFFFIALLLFIISNPKNHQTIRNRKHT